jgi:hypothetical protein
MNSTSQLAIEAWQSLTCDYSLTPSDDNDTDVHHAAEQTIEEEKCAYLMCLCTAKGTNLLKF